MDTLPYSFIENVTSFSSCLIRFYLSTLLSNWSIIAKKSRSSIEIYINVAAEGLSYIAFSPIHIEFDLNSWDPLHHELGSIYIGKQSGPQNPLTNSAIKKISEILYTTKAPCGLFISNADCQDYLEEIVSKLFNCIPYATRMRTVAHFRANNLLLEKALEFVFILMENCLNL